MAKLEGRYIFENLSTGRYLFQTDTPAGNEITFPKCVGADANYLNRAIWKIIPQDDDQYRIQNEVTGNYLYQPGKIVTKEEGGWGHAPTTVGADDGTLYAAKWNIYFEEEYYLIKNVENKRFVLQTGEIISGEHGSEEGWAHAPKAVGADGDYYGLARWRLIKQ